MKLDKFKCYVEPDYLLYNIFTENYFSCVVSCCLQLSDKQETKQTPWPLSASELYRPSDRRKSGKIVATFADRVVSRSQRGESSTAVTSVLDTRAIILSFKQLLNFTHEAEWTSFQTHYFSENLVAPGMEPGSLNL
jgi:hypothetical protein